MAVKRIIAPRVLRDLFSAYDTNNNTNNMYLANNHYNFGVSRGISLIQSGFTFNPSSHLKWDDISSHALPSGNGYSPLYLQNSNQSAYGSYNYTNYSDNYSMFYYYATNDTFATWTANGGQIGPTSGCCFYFDYYQYPYSKWIYAYIDFGEDVTVNDGDSLIVKGIDRFVLKSIDSPISLSTYFLKCLSYYYNYSTGLIVNSLWHLTSSNSSDHKLLIILMDDSFVWNPSNHKRYSDVSSHALPSGNGYSPTYLSYKSIGYVTNNGIYSFLKYNDIAWSISGGSISTNGALIYRNDSSASNDPDHLGYPILGYIDFGGTQTINDGDGLVVNNIEFRLTSGDY